MPLTVTTVTTGTAINASTLTSYCASIEHYINEGIVSGDLQSTAWVRSSRVYGPDFTTGIIQNSRLVSGEAHWTRRGISSAERSIHHPQINTGITAGTAGAYVPVDGMTRTFAVPEALSASGDPTHRVRVCMDWYCHELGGKGTIDDSTDHCADFALFVNGVSKGATARPLYTASNDSGQITIGAAKQYSIRYAALLTTAGVQHVGLRIRSYALAVGGGNFRHIFIWARTASWSWFAR